MPPSIHWPPWTRAPDLVQNWHLAAGSAPAKVTKASPVSIVLSSGPPMAVVPNVIGLSQAKAAAALVHAGAALGAVSTAVNSLPAGEVFFQSPAAGGEVALGGAVRLTVSKGPG